MELLGVDRVSRNDNFFELGGHSLLTIALIDRLAQQGFRLDIRTLFDQPTLSGMAYQIAESPLPENATASIPPGTTALTPAHFPLTTLSQPQIDAIVAIFPGGPSQHPGHLPPCAAAGRHSLPAPCRAIRGSLPCAVSSGLRHTHQARQFSRCLASRRGTS